MSDLLLNVADGSTFGPGQKVLVGPFFATNLTTSMSAVALTLGAAATETIPAAYAGSILAIMAALDTAAAAGTVNVFATVNGTTVFQTGTFSAKKKTVKQDMDVDKFVADDFLGVKVTTTANLTASRDLAVYLVVEL